MPPFPHLDEISNNHVSWAIIRLNQVYIIKHSVYLFNNKMMAQCLFPPQANQLLLFLYIIQKKLEKIEEENISLKTKDTEYVSM